MERLWSPWRMEYIQEARGDEEDGCVFCRVLELPDDDPEARILVRRTLGFVTLAKYPYNPGHLLILPIRHVGDLGELRAEESAEIDDLLKQGVRALRDESDPAGFNIGLNLGRTAGAGIPGHLHWHVVPRWAGDTNFMPVIGETRVLPELLAETYGRLRGRFAS